ncbi:hypothetical protein [Bacillus sp. BP-3]|uniref:hypothetical protein n=1 Tax=Bacillus sp. BP-3 TaxID=3022773 RepID=UPI00232DF222|nr:hypothetical protein [Bacillus sp. BP-3]MDC2867521.1 hypothetical protein [Bacillus sp. BP-3]
MKYKTVIAQKYYEIAAKNGINKQNVYQRVYLYGWNIERAITEPVKTVKNKHEHMILIAERNGISRITYFKRLKEGMTPQQAATRPKGLTVFLEIALENGIKEITFYKRVARGMELYEAATKPTRKYKNEQIS